VSEAQGGVDKETYCGTALDIIVNNDVSDSAMAAANEICGWWPTNSQ